MLRRIIPIVLVVVLIAGAAGIYLFRVNSAHFDTLQTTAVTVDGNAVHFVDSESNAVSGVMCNVCDETTCTMLTADENGLIELPGDAFPYEIQFLKVPEGYKLPEEPIVVDGTMQIVTYTLEKE